jgi:hypothetical protein
MQLNASPLADFSLEQQRRTAERVSQSIGKSGARTVRNPPEDLFGSYFELIEDALKTSEQRDSLEPTLRESAARYFELAYPNMRAIDPALRSSVIPYNRHAAQWLRGLADSPPGDLAEYSTVARTRTRQQR